mgnify:CR=1 FL=1
MIQRIQSAYLLLVVVLMGVTMGMPLGIYIGKAGNAATLYAYGLDIAGVQQDSSCWGIFAIALLSAITAFATIFLYKNRKLQIRLTIFNILVCIGWYATFAAFVLSYKEQLASNAFNCNTGAILPLVAIILDLLAIRGIRKDERLVKAADRLR